MKKILNLIILVAAIVALTVLTVFAWKEFVKNISKDDDIETKIENIMTAEEEFVAKYPNLVFNDERVTDTYYNRTDGGYEIVQTVNAPVDEIIPYYFAKFGDSDWIVVEQPEMDNSTEQRFVVTDENVTITVTADSVGEDTEVLINIEG